MKYLFWFIIIFQFFDDSYLYYCCSGMQFVSLSMTLLQKRFGKQFFHQINFFGVKKSLDLPQREFFLIKKRNPSTFLRQRRTNLIYNFCLRNKVGMNVCSVITLSRIFKRRKNMSNKTYLLEQVSRICKKKKYCTDEIFFRLSKQIALKYLVFSTKRKK